MFSGNYLPTKNHVGRDIPIKDIDKLGKSIEPVFTNGRNNTVNSGTYIAS